MARCGARRGVRRGVSQVGPDLDGAALDAFAALALDPRNGVAGLVVSNTTSRRPSGGGGDHQPDGVSPTLNGVKPDRGKPDGGKPDGGMRLASPEALWREPGGLSGAPLSDPARQALRGLYQRTAGRVALVGVGGIASGADAYQRIRDGARFNAALFKNFFFFLLSVCFPCL